MKPLNSKERQNAFLRFLILFIGTSWLIVAAVYFGTQVPFKQNERLKRQVTAYDRERAFIESFGARMSDVKAELDTINRQDVQAELNDGRINEKLKGLNAMIDADSVADKKFYQNIVTSLADLQIAKKQLRSESGKDANVSALQKQVESLTNDLTRSQAEANSLRNQQPLPQAQPQPQQR